MSCVIRTMVRGDAQEMRPLYPPTFSPEAIQHDIDHCLRGMRLFYMQGLVAFMDGQLVGTARAHKLNDPLRSHLGQITDVAVLKEFRGRGIATLLVTELLVWLHRRRAQQAILSVRGESNAQRLYSKLGFVEYGRLPNGLKEGWGDQAVYDEVLMTKVL